MTVHSAFPKGLLFAQSAPMIQIEWATSRRNRHQYIAQPSPIEHLPGNLANPKQQSHRLYE
jgi:hypothetical protein